MSAITRNQISYVSLLGAGLLASARRAAATAGRLYVAWNNRRGLTLLAHLDDRALGDIGLSRSDVRDALAQPWWNDPTVMLNHRRGESRVANRGKLRARD